MEIQQVDLNEVDELRRAKEAYMEEARVAREDASRWRTIDSNRSQQFTDFASDVSAFVAKLAEDEVIEQGDDYTSIIQKWLDKDIIDDPFVSEVSYKVTVRIERTFEVLVKHPTKIGDVDIEYKLVDAFERANGDHDCVEDDLGDDCEIQDISTYDEDVEVEAKAR